MVYNFEKIYIEYYDKILSFVKFKTNNEALAEEITSDTFVHVYNKLSTYNIDLGKISTWIYTIAKNLIIDNYRKKRLETNSYSDDTDFKTVVTVKSEELNPEEIMSNAESIFKLKKLIHGLETTSKRLFILRYFCGYSYLEMSEILNIPLGTVKAMLHRAKINITNQMKVQF